MNKEEITETTTERVVNCNTNLTSDWKERIEHKIDMLYEELLEFREIFNDIQSQQFIEKLKNEKTKLEDQLSAKTSSIQNIENQQFNSYRDRYEKLERLRGLR